MKHTIGKSRGLRRVNFSSSPIRAAAAAAATGRRWTELALQLAVRRVENNKTGDEDDNKEQVEGVDEGEEITRVVEQNDVIFVNPPPPLSFLFFSCVCMVVVVNSPQFTAFFNAHPFFTRSSLHGG